MTRLLLATALLAAWPALAQEAPAREQEVTFTDVHMAGVSDPRGFVSSTYADYQAHPDRPPSDQTYAYSPRLRRLFRAYHAWQRQHQDLVGSLDFDWWTNAQDYELRNVRVTQRPAGANRRWVVARFDNLDRHDEVRFLFVRLRGRWFLDDAMQGTGRGGNGWTLSALLRSREE